MRFENTLTIHAPVGEVFAYLARPENLPRWNYALDRTEQTSPGPIGVGTTCGTGSGPELPQGGVDGGRLLGVRVVPGHP
ncbi:SRPBCC family protein [Kitasatospora sp. NPDC002543]